MRLMQFFLYAEMVMGEKKLRAVIDILQKKGRSYELRFNYQNDQLESEELNSF
jgi:hypothetical protein